MKRFIKFLTEAEAPQPAVPTPDAAPASPTSMPNPFWFGASPTQPAPTQQPNPNAPPDQIDWDEIRKDFDETFELLEEMNRILRSFGYDALLEFLKKMGIAIPTNLDRHDLISWIQNYFHEKLTEQFFKKYPNFSPEQVRTFDKMMEQYFFKWFRQFQK